VPVSGLRATAVLAVLGLGASLSSGVAALAQELVAPLSTSPVAAVLPVETFQLENGLTVVVSEDRSAPVTAVSVWYHVGGAHELEGRTGLAHLAPPRLPPFPVVPAGSAERRATVSDPGARAPLLWVAYAVREAVDEDLYALSLLSEVMGAGRSSRLERALVGRARVARSVVSLLNRRRGPGSLVLGALAAEGADPERLERDLLSVVDSIREHGVTPAELEAAKNQRRASEVAARLTLSGRAAELQRHQLYGGSAVRANSELERYDAVTREDILRVARRYLTAENRAVVLTEPLAPGLASGAERPGDEPGGEPSVALRQTPPASLRQTPPASLRQTPPAVTPPAPPAFPTLEERKLGNGAEVLILRDSLLPWVDVTLMIPGGRAAESAGLAGTAELVAHLITRGTDLRSSADLAQAMDRLGATLSVVAGTDWITVSLGSLTVHLESAMTLMADAVLHPSFPQGEVQRIRRQGVIALQSGWTDSRALASRTFRRAVYGAHPYGAHESPEGVGDVIVADLRAYHRRVFRPEGAVFLVSGDADPDAVASLLDSRFSEWTTGREAPVTRSRSDPSVDQGVAPEGGGVLIVHAPGSTRAVIRMGHTLPAGHDPDWAAFSLLGQIVGGGSEARLGAQFQARGWSGSATATLDRRRGPGLFQVDASRRTSCCA